MKRTALLGGVALALLALAFVAGRATAPTKTIEKVRTVEITKEVAAKQKETTSVQAESVARRDETRWRVKYVARPDGTVVATAESGTSRAEETNRRREDARRETEVVYRDKIVEVERLRVVEAKRPGWGIGAQAGLGRGATAVYGASVHRRIVGPLWLGVYATTAKEAGVAVRFEF